MVLKTNSSPNYTDLGDMRRTKSLKNAIGKLQIRVSHPECSLLLTNLRYYSSMRIPSVLSPLVDLKFILEALFLIGTSRGFEIF